MPGRYHLQAIERLFKRNELVRGKFVGLGRTLDLKSITVPLYLIAGASDDITPKGQVFNAARAFGTPASRIVNKEVAGGHIGLFMGSRALAEVWPNVAQWLLQQDSRLKRTIARVTSVAVT